MLDTDVTVPVPSGGAGAQDAVVEHLDAVVLQRSLDFGVLSFAPAETGLGAVVVGDDELVMLTAPTHPLAIRIGGKDNHQIPLHGSCTVAPVNQEIVYELAYQQDEERKMLENNLIAVADDEQTQMVVVKSDSEYFVSSNGSRTGYLQIVLLRRMPRESEVMEISKADRDAAAREAKRLSDEMDEAAKPEAQRKKPKPSGK